ncbi:hypothetical protein ACTFIR_001140 [Dictyostelium discoideum]
MFKFYSIFFLIFLISLFSFSNSLISNYVPITGSSIMTPADFSRASLLLNDDQTSILVLASTIQVENPSDVFNITFSKYFLNNIIALSNNDLFGASSHYQNLISLYNNVNNLAIVSLNNTVGYINTLSKFTNMDTSRFNTISSSINNLITNIDSVKQSAVTLATLMNNTKNSLSPNSPNVATFQVVFNNYELVIKSVLSVSSHLNNLKTPLYEIANLMPNFINEVNLYSEFILTDALYMSHMNVLIKKILLSSDTLYSRSLLLSRLKDLF